MKKLMMALFSLVILCGTAWAEQGPQIFKQFYHGMPKAEVMQAGAVSCEELAIFEPGLKNSYCMPDPVKFAGAEWLQFFIMDTYGELEQVTMLKDAEQDDLDTMLNFMVQGGFVGTYLIADDVQVDFFSYHAQDKSDELNERIFDIFAAEPENVTFNLLEGKALQKVKRAQRTNMMNILINAPASTRAVDIVQGDGTIGLKFYLPVMARIEGEQKARQLQEDF